MKTKNTLTLIMFSTTIFFNITNISANNEIDQFLNRTPSQLSSINIYYYLTQATNKYKNNNFSQKSRINIFNKALSRYIKEIYNNKYYSNYLSQDGSAIIELLELNDELNLGITSLYKCLRLFYNKIKACELIDDTVLLQVLKPLPIFVKKYFSKKTRYKNNIKFLRKSIEKTILFKFSDHIAEFQNEPNFFISQLSRDISKIAQKEIIHTLNKKKQSEMKERLRNLIIRFSEITINKLIWDIKSYENIWESILAIANNIIRLADYNVIEHMDDLDDLLWSLTHRFCYFLNLYGSYLPLEFFDEIENDIISQTAFFLEIEEQDNYIKTKKETILDAIITAKTKSIAFNEGLFSDQIIS